MHLNADKLLEIDVATLSSKQREIYQIELLQGMLKTLVYIERNLRPVSPVASVIELEAKPKPKSGE